MLVSGSGLLVVVVVGTDEGFMGSECVLVGITDFVLDTSPSRVTDSASECEYVKSRDFEIDSEADGLLARELLIKEKLSSGSEEFGIFSALPLIAEIVRTKITHHL